MLGLAQQLTLTLSYVLLVLAGVGVLPLLASTIASGAVLFAGTAVLVRGRVPIVPAFDRRIWRQLLKETLPYAMATAVGIIYFREALVLMSALSSEHEVSYYSAAFRIVEVLAVIPYVLVASSFPILTRAAIKDDRPRLAYAIQRLFDIGLIGGIWMAASIVVGASFGIRVVAGPGFEPSIPVLQIQGLAIAMSSWSRCSGPYSCRCACTARSLERARGFGCDGPLGDPDSVVGGSGRGDRRHLRRGLACARLCHRRLQVLAGAARVAFAGPPYRGRDGICARSHLCAPVVECGVPVRLRDSLLRGAGRPASNPVRGDQRGSEANPAATQAVAEHTTVANRASTMPTR